MGVLQSEREIALSCECKSRQLRGHSQGAGWRVIGWKIIKQKHQEWEVCLVEGRQGDKKLRIGAEEFDHILRCI